MIRCKLGFHKWKYEREDNPDMAFRENINDLFLAIDYRRICLRCGKKQAFTPHGWLDLN